MLDQAFKHLLVSREISLIKQLESVPFLTIGAFWCIAPCYAAAMLKLLKRMVVRSSFFNVILDLFLARDKMTFSPFQLFGTKLKEIHSFLFETSLRVSLRQATHRTNSRVSSVHIATRIRIREDLSVPKRTRHRVLNHWLLLFRIALVKLVSQVLLQHFLRFLKVSSVLLYLYDFLISGGLAKLHHDPEQLTKALVELFPCLLSFLDDVKGFL